MSSRARACRGFESTDHRDVTRTLRKTAQPLCKHCVNHALSLWLPLGYTSFNPVPMLSQHLSYLGDTGTCPRLPWSAPTHLKTDPCCITAWTGYTSTRCHNPQPVLRQASTNPVPFLHRPREYRAVLYLRKYFDNLLPTQWSNANPGQYLS